MSNLTDGITIYTDGGSRGNPGPAAAAFVLSDKDNNQLQAKGFFLGKTTNNVAEYTAVIKALEAAKQINAQHIELFSDSELLVKQINGQYRVKSENLKSLYNKSIELLSCFKSWKVTHITRDKNILADDLANSAMDKKADVDRLIKKRRSQNIKPLRLGVLISGGGTTLTNLLDHIKNGQLNAEVACVISSRSAVAGVERAKNAGLDVKIVRKKDFPDIEKFSKRIVQQLEAANVDLVIQGGWLCLWEIPPQYENRVMNIHPALLPAFGGEGMWGHHVHEAVLKAAVKVSGCTVHFCTNEYDKGPIIVQRTCEVRDCDTADTLAGRVFEQECIAYPEAIRLFAENKLTVKNRIVHIAK